MIPRILEPEAMDTPDEALDYDGMDHSGVNHRFAADFLAIHGPSRGGEWIDIGTGPALIPIVLCQLESTARVVATDLSDAMLQVASRNIERAQLQDRIRCERADAKHVVGKDAAFEAVLSNSIIHHIAEPGLVLAEMARLLAPEGTLFVRDLVRPDNMEQLKQLVETYAGHETPSARALFAASLHAALTMEEIKDQVERLGFPRQEVTQTSDRHWTWIWKRPGRT